MQSSPVPFNENMEPKEALLLGKRYFEDEEVKKDYFLAVKYLMRDFLD